MFPQLTAG
jgi:hypothetical protein